MRTKALIVCLTGVLLVSVTASPTTTQDSGQASVVAPNNNNTSTSNTTASTQAVSNATTASNVTQASSDATSNASTEAEDDDTLPEGMSESLADFVMDMLKGQFGNATRKASTAATVSASNTNTTLASGSNTNSTLASSTSAESSNTTTVGAEAGKTGTENTEKPTPPASTDEWEYATYDEYDEWTSTEDYLSTTREPFSKDGKANCNAEVDLNNYCIVDDLVSAYFHDDLTAKGLRSPIFDMDIVERLKSCPRGEWCLDNELDAFKGMQQRFYKGPLCEETMWECIFDIMVQREQCEDKEFMFVVDAADLMCELFEMPPIEENEKRCFAHVLAALHVTYADFLARNMSDVKPETVATCEGYGFKMTKTYLCADSSCDDLFDSRIAMEKFARWGWFVDKVEDRVIKCDLSDKDTCGPLKEERPATSRTWFGMTTESFWPDYTTTTDSYLGDDYYDQGGSVDLNGEKTAEEDESLMMALSVASAVGLLFMVLGLVFWRRNRRRNLLYYRGDGYGKLSADEGPLLPKSSD